MNLRKMAEAVTDRYTTLKSEALRTRRDHNEEQEDDDEPTASQMPRGTIASRSKP